MTAPITIPPRVLAGNGCSHHGDALAVLVHLEAALVIARGHVRQNDEDGQRAHAWLDRALEYVGDVRREMVYAVALEDEEGSPEYAAEESAGVSS